jgi:TonB family protein
MKKKLISSCIFLVVATLPIYSQELPKFVVTDHGVDSIVIRVGGAKAQDIYEWSMAWVEKNYQNTQVTRIKNRSIQFNSFLDNAFTATHQNLSFFFDIIYNFQIEIKDSLATLKFRIGPVWWHPRREKADFSYLSFFKKNGQVKDSYARSKMTLERSINLVPSSLAEYLKNMLSLHTPTLRQTDFEKGYVKEEMKYSVWQYFNPKKEVELVINHSTGRLIYEIPDTSSYLVFNNGEWVASKLDVRPIPVTGFHNYYESVLDALGRSVKLCRDESRTRILVSFEIDTAGSSGSYKVINGIEKTCDEVVLSCLKSVKKKWVPARVGKKLMITKFALGITFDDGKGKRKYAVDNNDWSPQAGTLLEELIVKNLISDDQVFTFVEKPAEFVGGLQGFYLWLSKNLRYPASARRMGLEGKVFVKFIIEPSGAITNAEVVKGINGDCDREALRVISSSPNWVPGTQRGRPVRQSYQLPIVFKLSE